MGYLTLKLQNTRSACGIILKLKLHYMISYPKFSQPLCVSAQEKAVEIQPADIEVPKISFTSDPDYLYDDYFYDPG